MSAARLNFLLNNFNLSTWLIAGATLQSILSFFLPRNVALLPAVILLISRLISGALTTKGFLRNKNLDGAFMGRWTASMLNEDGSVPVKTADKEIVVFVVGARSNHPMGVFEPGFRQLSTYFQDMWKDAEVDREKWGYLGKSSPMITVDTGAVITLSYWKSMDHLHAFARGDAHRQGWDWWNKTVKEHDHLGIMHEVYAVPTSHWENIYVNMHPFGMGQTKYLPTAQKTIDEYASQESPEEQRLLSPLIEAKGGKWKSMTSRMGRVGL